MLTEDHFLALNISSFLHPHYKQIVCTDVIFRRHADYGHHQSFDCWPVGSDRELHIHANYALAIKPQTGILPRHCSDWFCFPFFKPLDQIMQVILSRVFLKPFNYDRYILNPLEGSFLPRVAPAIHSSQSFKSMKDNQSNHFSFCAVASYSFEENLWFYTKLNSLEL